MGELNIFNKEIYSYLLLMQWLIVYCLCGWNIIDSGEQRGERWQVKKYLFKWKMCERWEIWNSSNKWWITFLSMWKVTGDISVKAMAAVPPHTHPAPPLSHHHGPLPKSRRDGNGATSLKKQQIWPNQAGESSQGMWWWERWRRSWCCNHIFCVRSEMGRRGGRNCHDVELYVLLILFFASRSFPP